MWKTDLSNLEIEIHKQNQRVKEQENYIKKGTKPKKKKGTKKRKNVTKIKL